MQHNLFHSTHIFFLFEVKAYNNIIFFINLASFLGHGDVNNNNHQPTEAQELNRHITAPGNDDYQLILPDYRADIPKKFEDRMYFFYIYSNMIMKDCERIHFLISIIRRFKIVIFQNIHLLKNTFLFYNQNIFHNIVQILVCLLGEYNIKPGIQPTEIIRHQRDDRDIRRAALLD
jgi:hypothetical protein